MFGTFKDYVRLLAFLLISFHFTGCLEKDVNLSPLQRSVASDETIDPYANCAALSEAQIYDLSKDNPDIVENGSFEEGHTQTGKSWKAYDEFGAWKSLDTIKTSPFEVMKDDAGGIFAYDGRTKVELDSNDNSGMEQTVVVEAGKTYKISLQYSPRYPNNMKTNPVELRIDGETKLTMDTTGVKEWNSYEATFTATSNSVKVQLVAVGVSDARGGYVDSVVLKEVGLTDAPNLIQNGSFEEGSDFTAHNGRWNYFHNIPAWNSFEIIIKHRLEIQTGAVGDVEVQDGITKTELDAFKENIKLYQDLTTEVNKKYILRFYYSPRVIGDNDTNRGEVYWNGTKVKDLSGTQRGWVENLIVLDAFTANSRIEFHGKGREDGRGAFIDNISIHEVNCNIPSEIVVYPDVRDLVNGTDIQKNYRSDIESAVLMYSANDIQTNKAIESVKWTYGGKVTEGWSFKAYMNENIGSTVGLEIKDTNGYIHTDSFAVSFQDTCDTISDGEDYGFCLRTNQVEADGDYIKGANGDILFYLSHGDPLEGNISNARAYIEYEDSDTYGESIEITDLVTFQGQNLVVNPLSLATLDLDTSKRIFVRLVGDYETVAVPYDIQTTTAKSRAFSLGVSNLNLNFDDNVTHLSIVSSTARFGRIEDSAVGTSFNLSSIPVGTYTIEAKSETKTSLATIFVGALENVDVSFAMQSKDPSSEGRLLMSESFIVSRTSITPPGGVNSFAVSAFASPGVENPQVVYLVPADPGPFTQTRFENNFIKIKKQFLEDENAEIPAPTTSLYFNHVNGSVPGYEAPGPNKFVDKDVALEPGQRYMHFIYGEHPLLFRARSMRALKQLRDDCISDPDVAVIDCVREYRTAVSIWDAFEDISSHIEVDIRYTVTGQINGEDQEVVYDYKFSSKDFVNENGGIGSASLNWAFSSTVDDGWLLQKPKQIFIPGNMTDPKVTAELLTPFPKDVTRGNQTVRRQNFWINLSVGLVNVQRTPSITKYLQHDGVVDKEVSGVKTPELHANLLTSFYKMFPVHGALKQGEYYFNKDLSVKFLVEIDQVEGYEAKGVWGHMEYNGSLYPNTAEGIRSKVTDFKMIDDKRATFTVTRKDFFGEKKFPFDPQKGLINLNLGLVLIDKKHPELGEVLGPVGQILEFKPQYNIANSAELPYEGEPHLYSTPNFTHAGRNMTKLFSSLMNSSLYSSNEAQNKLFYNDASLPFGGLNMNHSGEGHKKGSGVDFRYPAGGPKGGVNSWDQTRQHFNKDGVEDVIFDDKFCNLSSALQTGYGRRTLYHGHNKIKAMKRYLWIKRYANEVNSLYSEFFAPEYRGRSLKNENLNGDLLTYIHNTFCKSQSPKSSACMNLEIVNTPENRSLVLGLISYVSSARSGIDTILSNGGDIKKVLISTGQNSQPCFPKNNSAIDFDYNENWHQILFQNGKMPDGASAGIGSWTPVISIVYDGKERVHMSHIHIDVTE